MTLVPWLLLPSMSMRMMGNGTIHESLVTLVCKTNGCRCVAVVGDGAIQGGHLIGSDGVAVERVIALHVDGVVGDSAHTEVNEVIHVEAFAGNAAVGRKEDGKHVGTATEEDLGIGEVGDLLPCLLWVP